MTLFILNMNDIKMVDYSTFEMFADTFSREEAARIFLEALKESCSDERWGITSADDLVKYISVALKNTVYSVVNFE